MERHALHNDERIEIEVSTSRDERYYLLEHDTVIVHAHRTPQIQQLNNTKHLFVVVTATDEPKWRKTAEGHERSRHLKDKCTLLGCTAIVHFRRTPYKSDSWDVAQGTIDFLEMTRRSDSQIKADDDRP